MLTYDASKVANARATIDGENVIVTINFPVAGGRCTKSFTSTVADGLAGALAAGRTALVQHIIAGEPCWKFSNAHGAVMHALQQLGIE